MHTVKTTRAARTADAHKPAFRRLTRDLPFSELLGHRAEMEFSAQHVNLASVP